MLYNDQMLEMGRGLGHIQGVWCFDIHKKVYGAREQLSANTMEETLESANNVCYTE